MDDDEEHVVDIYRATLAAIRPALVDVIAEDADRAPTAVLWLGRERSGRGRSFAGCSKHAGPRLHRASRRSIRQTAGRVGGWGKAGRSIGAAIRVA
jgi:hypothetical protein